MPTSVAVHKMSQAECTSGVSQQQLAELAIANHTAATDVGIYGLLASQSCYHSMLVPCYFSLWTSGRIQNPTSFCFR